MMNRELLIVRHAKSSWKDPHLRDFDRPLKGRGKRDALRMGTFLRKNRQLPDHVLCSSAFRAVETAKRLVSAMGLEHVGIQPSPKLYLAGVDRWMEFLHQTPPAAGRLLVVGHNPGLEMLLLHLCRDALQMPDDGKLLPTATLALLEFSGLWSGLRAGTCSLRVLQRPRLLPP